MRETQSTIHKPPFVSIENGNYDERLKGSASEVLETLERVIDKIAPGPAPSFNEAHVVKALEIIADHGIVGRISLSNKLELGIGTTRTVLRHLKKEQLIVSSKNGYAFSDRGKKLFSKLRCMISGGVEMPNSPLTVGPSVIAVLVRDMGHKVGRGVEQRNTAIRVGASGATTLIFSGDRLTMASKRDHALRGVSDIEKALVSKLNPKENDVIIVGSGECRADAEIGAVMAAIKLMNVECKQ